MANCFLAYPNRVDQTATFSGGSWTTGLPLSNMGTRHLKQVARSTNLSTSSTWWKLKLPVQRTIRTVCLVGMNLFIGATVRVRVYTLDTDTTPVYDSNNFQVYPVGTAPFGSALWGTEQWWGGVPSQEDLKTHANNVIHILPEVVHAETVRVDIVDTSNPLGYVEVGRMFVGDGWQPGINMSYGASLGYESRTTVEEAIGGAEYFDVRKPVRVAKFKLDALTESEAIGRVMDMQRLVDVHGEVMYIWDPDDTSHLARRSFLGRLRELNPIEHPYYNNYTTAFEVKELL